MSDTPLPSRADDDAKGSALRAAGSGGGEPGDARDDVGHAAQADVAAEVGKADLLAAVLTAVMEARALVAVAAPRPWPTLGHASVRPGGGDETSPASHHPSAAQDIAEAVEAACAIVAKAFPGASEPAAPLVVADPSIAPTPAPPETLPPETARPETISPEAVPLAQRLASAMRAAEPARALPAAAHVMDRGRLHQMQVEAAAVAAATMAPFAAAASRAVLALHSPLASPGGDLDALPRIAPADTHSDPPQAPSSPAPLVAPLQRTEPLAPAAARAEPAVPQSSDSQPSSEDLPRAEITVPPVTPLPPRMQPPPPKLGVLPPSARRIGIASAYRRAAAPPSAATIPTAVVVQPILQPAIPQAPLPPPPVRAPISSVTGIGLEHMVPAAPSRPLSVPLPRDRRRSAGAWVTWAAQLALRGLVVVALIASLFWTTALIAYRYVDPPASTLMLGQSLLGRPIEQRWVTLDRVSPNLIRAVIASEDGQFCRHRGVDWGAINEAIGKATEDGAKLRGASTITMQTVKNLLLWPQAHLLRKLLEVPLAYAAERVWGKRRILELYLNIAEWGPNLYGIEAAAQHQFRKSASQLGPREAALLAVSLPNPIERKASRPGPGMSRVARVVETRAARPALAVGCLGSLGRAVP